jgi:hypothetical protein
MKKESLAYVVMIDDQYFYIKGLTEDVKTKLNALGYKVGVHKDLDYHLIKNDSEIKIINDLIDSNFAFASDSKDIGGGPAGVLGLLSSKGKIRKKYKVCSFDNNGFKTEEVSPS